MATKNHTKVDGYKHVYYIPTRQGTRQLKPYIGQFTLDKQKHNCGQYDNARDCAIAVDKNLIRLGKPPVNVLKKKVS